MILIIHDHIRVVDVITSQECDSEKYKEEPILLVLFSLAALYPEQKIGWVHYSLAENLDFSGWDELLKHPLELLTYEPGEQHYMHSDIEYIDFFSPFVRFNEMKSVRYLTWMASASMGCAYASLIQVFLPFREIEDFHFFLLFVSKSGSTKGLLPYMEPGLDTRLKKTSYCPPSISSEYFFTFIKTFYSNKSIVQYFLLKQFGEKRSEQVFSYIAALKAKKLIKNSISLSSLHQYMSSVTVDIDNSDTVDVIIPTLGRKKYLYDVLKDLSVQTHKPKKVIIVEQNPDVEDKSELDYLTDEVWPFEIEHIFIHQLGACNARNLAIEKVSASYAFFADDDIRLEPKTIQHALETMQCYCLDAVTLAVYQKNENIHKKEYPVLWSTFGSGCSIVISTYVKETFFDLALEFGYGEDMDYGDALRKKGCSITYLSKDPMLHLKAPVGGFRFTFQHEWSHEKPLPKPSPTVMYNFMKNATEKQLKGYKLFHFYKRFLQERAWNMVAFYRKFNTQWNKSTYWANRLKDRK